MTYTALLIFIAIFLIFIICFLLLEIKKEKKQRINAEKKIDNIQYKVNKLELENLESKLNPHLFKNTLNTIQSHAYQTYFALEKLANVLDYILYESRNNYVTPKEEIEFALNLIEINKIKISPLFDVKVKTNINELEPLFEQKLLAPLITIDLIENAFKHCNLQNPEAFIYVIFEFKNNVFSLTVSNKVSDKKTLKKEHSGIGINTLIQRLNIIYSDNYKFEQYIDNETHISHLKINLLEHKTKMLNSR